MFVYLFEPLTPTMSRLCIYSSVNSSVMILFKLVALFKDKTKRTVSSFFVTLIFNAFVLVLQKL